MVRSKLDTKSKTALYAKKLYAIVMQILMADKVIQYDLEPQSKSEGKTTRGSCSTRGEGDHKSMPPTPVTKVSSISREANGKVSCQENVKSLGEVEPVHAQVYNSLQRNITGILPSHKDQGSCLPLGASQRRMISRRR